MDRPKDQHFGVAARLARFACAMLLVGAGFCGLAHAVRASVAQRMYLRAKYGFFRATSFEIPSITNGADAVEICRRAERLYPWNWYFPSWAAKIAYLEATDPATPDDRWQVALADATALAAEALALNPYDAEIRWVYAETMVANGRLPEAIAWWRGIVDLEYWNPENQRELASLLLREGSEESISEALTLIPLVYGDMRKRLSKIQHDRKKAAAEAERARKKAAAEAEKARKKAAAEAEKARKKAAAEARKAQ